MATNIDGKAFAAKIRSQVKEDADKLIANKQVDPCLAVVLVGENPASKVYVGAKTKMAAECNIKTKDYKLDEDTDQETLLKLIKMLNEDTDIHGILVQLPLPKQIDERSVIDAIAVEKDVDGFHAINAGRLSIGGDMLKKAFIPCTPLGSLLLLKDKYDEYELLPQTMPPFPWHQGGRAFHNLLRSYDDIKDLKEKTDLNICLDFSHTFMECNYSNFSFYEQ